jgi:hypothetical protein
MNHEQQVGRACEKRILLNKGCLFTILLQSIQQENNVTKGLVKITKETVKKCKKMVDGVNHKLRKGDFLSSPDLKNTQTAVALSDLTRKA